MKSRLASMGRALACAGVVGLAACGTAPGERALSGAGIGAGAGAAVGAVTGLSVGSGAALGAAAGAAAGGLTRRDQLDLGDPAWNKRKR